MNFGQSLFLVLVVGVFLYFAWLARGWFSKKPTIISEENKQPETQHSFVARKSVFFKAELRKMVEEWRVAGKSNNEILKEARTGFDKWQLDEDEVLSVLSEFFSPQEFVAVNREEDLSIIEVGSLFEKYYTPSLEEWFGVFLPLTSDDSQYEKVANVCALIKSAQNTSWEDDDWGNFEFEDIVRVISNLGLSNLDVIKLLWNESGAYFGSIVEHLPVKLDPTSLGQIAKTLEVNFTDEDQRNAMSAVFPDTDGDIEFYKAMGLSLEDLLGYILETNDDLTDVVSALVDGSYESKEILYAVYNNNAEMDYGKLVSVACDVEKITHQDIAEFIFEEDTDLEDFDEELRNEDIALEDRVRILGLILDLEEKKEKKEQQEAQQKAGV